MSALVGDVARSGRRNMVASCCFFSLMFVFAYQAARVDPTLSPPAVSFTRTMVNLLFVIGLSLRRGTLRGIFGDCSGSLWLRGLFGGVNLLVVFHAIRAIGIGESSFLGASSGPIVALLAPWILGQRNDGRVWLAIGGSLVGLYLLFEPRFTDAHSWGRALALSSGLFAALAYLMVARAGTRNSPETVVFYFCLMSLLIHSLYFVTRGVTWPRSPGAWLCMITAGLAGSIAQHLMTLAYQRAPAAMLAAINYLVPVLNLIAGAALFAIVPDGKAWLGAALVLGFGVVLPFWRQHAAVS